MANATWLDPRATDGNSGPGADDVWHVVLSPGEVKTLTLEQLDDYFRLDLIGASTQVWGPEMTGWTTLGEVLGLSADDGQDEGEAEVVVFAEEPPASTPAPKLTPYGTVSVDPKQSDIPTVAFAYPGANTDTPRPRSAAPAPQPARALEPVSVVPDSAPSSPMVAIPAPTRSAPPPALGLSPAPMPWDSSPFADDPVRALVPPTDVFSLRPAALDLQHRRDALRAFASDPDISAQRSSSFGAWLMVAALLAGSAVTAYRNDLVREVAHRAGQDAAYARLEAALGGPAFGTPRSIGRQLPGTAEQSLSSAEPRTQTQTQTAAVAPAAQAAPIPAVAASTAATVERATEENAPASAARAVSLDTLPSDTSDAPVAPRKTAAPTTEAATSPATKAASEPALPAKPSPEARSDEKPEARTAAEPKAAATKEAMMAAFAATKTTRAAEPAPAKAPAPEPKPLAPQAKPAAEKPSKPVVDDKPLPGMPAFLSDAIKERIAHPSKKPSKPPGAAAPAAHKKKKGAGSDYDPLNSDL